MGKLIYLVTTSLDGFVANEKGDFEFTAPTEEVHVAVNGVMKGVGTFLLGRRMYETLAVWDSIPSDGVSVAVNQFANLWKAANKIVFSNSLTEVSTQDTTIQRDFDVALIDELVTKSEKDFGIGGPHLAAAAIRGGIVDELHQFIVPKIIGGGNHWLPREVEANLELVNLQKYENGNVHLQYKFTSS